MGFDKFSAPDATRLTLRNAINHAKVRIANASPLAAQFAQHRDDIPSATLLRHAIEQALRGNLFRPLDAMAFRMLKDMHSPAAPLWGLHGMSDGHRDSAALLYLRDAGLNPAAIAEMPLLTSTLRLRRFVEWATGLHGPMPILLNTLWMECSPELGSVVLRARAEAAAIDRVRVEGILDVVVHLVKDEAAFNAAEQLIDSIAQFSAMYFSELAAVCGTANPGERENRNPAIAGLSAR